MAKYLFIYTGGSMPETEADRAAATASWQQWFGKIGTGVADIGNPFGASKAVASNGSVANAAPSDLGGYSIINAGGLDAALDMAKGCPILTRGGSVEVYETINIM